ncbi:MAG: hypothetical protein WC839_01350 [Candidatus Paceibacterota bacterium]
MEFLTDKLVNDITISELRKYLSDEFVDKYLKDKANVLSLIKFSDFNQITIGKLEKYKTKINIHDYIFNNELSHAIVNTYELKEWIVLNGRFGLKVKKIIPPPVEVTGREPLVNGGDALSEQFILGKTKIKISKEYIKSITELNNFVKDKKTNIILFENPPYRDSSAANTDNLTNKTSKGTFVFENMKLDLKNLANSNVSTARDISNQFNWSGWKYYLTKPNDCYVLFSPIKYWKSLGLGNRKFIDGYLFNRKYFHASESSISCIAWQNENQSVEELTLKAFDIYTQNMQEQEEKIVSLEKITIKKAHSTLESYYDRRTFKDDIITNIYCEDDGSQITGRKVDGKSFYNKNIIGYLVPKGFAITQHDIHLLRATRYNIRGFYLRSDNFIEKLPLFAAKLYPQKNWYERDIYFTTAEQKSSRNYLNINY